MYGMKNNYLLKFCAGPFPGFARSSAVDFTYSHALTDLLRFALETSMFLIWLMSQFVILAPLFLSKACLY
jgi:hypothetical protein